MKPPNKNLLTFLTVLVAFLGWRSGIQAGPQDNWYLERTWGSIGTGDGQFRRYGAKGLTVGTDGKVYVVDLVQNRVQVFEQTGQFLRKWTTSNRPYCIAMGPDGNLYVGGEGPIQVYTPEGVFVRAWGSNGTGNGQFGGEIRGIAVSPEGKVFVSDQNNFRVQVFQSNGAFVTKWGSSRGSLPGQFYNPLGLSLDADGNVYVIDITQSGSRVQIFDQSGTYLRHFASSDGTGLCVGVDGNVIVAQGWDVLIYSKDGLLLQSWQTIDTEMSGIAMTPEGRLFVSDFVNSRIWVYARGFRSGPAIPVKYVPQPVVMKVVQRPTTTVLDIDYRVIDVDSATNEIFPLAFVDGEKSLSKVIRINTLLEGTESKQGGSILTNVPHRLTWNVAADWSVNFGEMKVDILAKDEREILSFDYITIPAVGPTPALKISRTPYGDNDFLPLWFWLIAKGDSSVNLVGGVVKAVGGAYDGQSLTSANTTTAAGRAFLFSKLNVREATTAEVARAKAVGTPTWVPRFSVGVGEYPLQINAYGFDVLAAGYSVVPLD